MSHAAGCAPCPTRAALSELWRPIAGHPGYEVSWDGRVRNARTGHVLKPQQAKGGHYTKVNLGRSCQMQVHQLVATAWHGPAPAGRPHVVDHIDNHGARNCATNLRWLTYSMNTRQWYAMNARMVAAGIENGHDLEPALSDDEWTAIHREYEAGAWGGGW